MLEARFANAAFALRLVPRPVRSALGWLAPEQDTEQELSPQPNPTARAGNDEFPAIIRKAQDDVRCRQELVRLGYSQVRAAYARHRQVGLDIFEDLGHAGLWPTIDFVRDWLKDERKRIVAQVRWSFAVAMLATILAGLAFIATVAVLR